ncbi:lipid II flippase MurJ [Microlunatus panaciterrae]|uniref:Peptidoglycan lipid II flippase n=1 Tax=Microlunatus panaciterrae TaxID=400768 RepID=A0ABS2RP02_9ACTN|nr:putative peptidoglycan lipid II flippase [Microlunatus panaciterrae]
MKAGGLGSVVLSVAALTLASRVVGFGRWLIFSKTVGDTCLGDVYNAANQLPNVLFEVVAGGVLAGVVIPVVARHVGARRNDATAATVSALLTWTLLVLTPAALAAFLGADLYARTFVSAGCGGGVDLGARLLTVFVPQIWLYGLAVVSAGILQAHQRFLAAAAAPLASSVVVISSYLIFAQLAGPAALDDLRRLGPTAVAVLGWGTTAGVAVLALMTLVPLARLGIMIRPRLRFAPGDTKVITRIGLASVAGLITQQVCVLLIIWTAKQTMDPGAVTRTTWANAIYLLPFAVLVAPMLQLAFPRLSAAAETGPPAVLAVLVRVAPAVVVLASLGGALLVATSVPVARVFVLGPGSGRTGALAFPIMATAPAVLGFGMLGLASRTLLAQHLARSAGMTTVAGWGATILAVLLVHLTLPSAWVVTGISAAMSVGMVTGGLVGWLLLIRAGSASEPAPRNGPSSGLLRSLAVAVPAALVSGVGVWFLSRGLADAGGLAAVLGAVGCALGCAALFISVVHLLDRRLLPGIVRMLRTDRVARAGGET